MEEPQGDQTQEQLRLEKEETLVSYRIIERMLQENLWRHKTDSNRMAWDTDQRILNKERVLEIAREEQEKHSPIPKITADNIPSQETLSAIAKRGLNAFVTYAVKSGLITKEVAVMTNNQRSCRHDQW